MENASALRTPRACTGQDFLEERAFYCFSYLARDSVEGRCSLQAYERLALHNQSSHISILHSLIQWLVSSALMLLDSQSLSFVT